jgi:hypothetical protein
MFILLQTAFDMDLNDYEQSLLSLSNDKGELAIEPFI